jgi:hypothetical protein
MIKKILILSIILLLSFSMAGAVMWDLKEIITGKQMVPNDNNGAPWLADSSKLYFGTGQDAYWMYNPAMDKIYLNDTAIYLEEAVTFGTGASGTWTGALTGTASRIAVGSFIDTGYGLKNSTANKAQINLSVDKGLAFDTAGSLGALRVVVGDGNDLGASGIAVDSTDLAGTSYGIKEVGTNDLGVNISADHGLQFGATSHLGELQVDPTGQRQAASESFRRHGPCLRHRGQTGRS